VRRMVSGTDRASGGAFERPQLGLFVFGADGLVTRWELFDIGHEAEALARFDEVLAAPAAVRPIQRRVRPNAATVFAALWEAAVAARDADALPALYADDAEPVARTPAAPWPREAHLPPISLLLRAEDPRCRLEPLATLGDLLALFRVSTSASRFVGGTFDVGAYQKEEIHLVEVDARGRCLGGEVFAVDQVGNAVVRLYERYAQLLPHRPAPRPPA